MENTNDHQLHKTSFLELIEDNVIEIPKIQRDYAQGRLSSKVSEIRDKFLSALIETLSNPNANVMILDFIYGTTTEDNIFIPLDGQQRLTTLFLLHWYLCPNDEMYKLQIEVNDTMLSRLTYKTRISSKDFCNELVNHNLTEFKINNHNCLAENGNELEEIQSDVEPKDVGIENKTQDSLTLSRVIKDQPWFSWEWRKDPTVKSMLVVLDELDDKIQYDDEERGKLWTGLEKKKIVFHLLPLEKFNLTDELYVKMNARGKELSEFDIFKSSLEEQMIINQVNSETYKCWKEKIDSDWLDVFWNHIAKEKLLEELPYEEQKTLVDSVEAKYLIFLKRMMIYYLLDNNEIFNNINWKDESIKRYIPFDIEEEKKIDILSSLRHYAVRDGVTDLIPLFNRTKFFDTPFFVFVIKVFEDFIYYDGNIKSDGAKLITSVSFSKDEKKSDPVDKNETIFDIILEEKTDYASLLQFRALLSFYDINSASNVNNDDVLKKELNSWMRIVRNLTTSNNVYFDSFDDFISTYEVFKKWSVEIYSTVGSKCANIYLSNNIGISSPKGRYVGTQFEEELIKSKLMSDPVNGNNWTDKIRKIEEHGYFSGQIKFLFDWSNNDDSYDLVDFKKYSKTIQEIFDENGLVSELNGEGRHLFRNCLMANYDNYLLNNEQTLVNDTGKDRDRSWKSYLRNEQKSKNIKSIIDKWSESEIPLFKDFCTHQIEANKSFEDWRRCFLNNPEVYNKCSKDQIGYFDEHKEHIFLLDSSKKWTGNNIHSELNTYYWSLMFNEMNDWNTVYFNSKEEKQLCTKFEKEKKVIECSFQYEKDKYIYKLSLNFDPNDTDYKFKDDKWIKDYNATDFFVVENELNRILL
jgi:hypothetical protein